MPFRKDTSLLYLKQKLRDSIRTLNVGLNVDLKSRFNNLVEKVASSPVLASQSISGQKPYISTKFSALSLIPVTTLYFCLFSLAFVYFSSRVWNARRRTRIYYGDGTSELCYALGSEQIAESYYNSVGSSKVDESTEEIKERAWRIENLKKVIYHINAVLVCFSYQNY